MSRPFIAGNWKMNTNSSSSASLAASISAGCSDVAGKLVDVLVCPPFVYLGAVVAALGATQISVGAQDLYTEQEGAFTGEISASMLKDTGCVYVLCGHSERRHIIGETDQLVNRKVSAAINGGLVPILCVGEKIQQRQSGKTSEVVNTQLNEGLADLNAEQISGVTMAYEPVWAIGTGLTATPAQAQEVHCLIREKLSEKIGKASAEKIRILYGGSAKPDNAADLMVEQDIDGLLVGGASLKADDFLQIIRAAI